jgi:L-asparagine transporter-like permease
MFRRYLVKIITIFSSSKIIFHLSSLFREGHKRRPLNIISLVLSTSSAAAANYGRLRCAPAASESHWSEMGNRSLSAVKWEQVPSMGICHYELFIISCQLLSLTTQANFFRLIEQTSKRGSIVPNVWKICDEWWIYVIVLKINKKNIYAYLILDSECNYLLLRD